MVPTVKKKKKLQFSKEETNAVTGLQQWSRSVKDLQTEEGMSKGKKGKRERVV